MSVAAADIRVHFGEFSGLSDTVIDRWLAQAERRVNRTQWGEKADDATLWLAGHLLKLHCMLAAGMEVAPGAVASKRVGDLAVAYKVPDKMGDTFLESTTYGQYYLSLRTGIWPTRVLGDTDTDYSV